MDSITILIRKLFYPVLFIFFLAARNCSAPNGLGLQNLFRQIDNILPKQRIRDIMKSYDEDSQVKALKAFLERPQTQLKIKTMRNSTEYRRLHDYVCRVLHINLLQYQILVRTLINPVAARSGAAKSLGIPGLLRAVNAVLPNQQIRALHRDLLASDPELVKAMNNLQSNEFRQLVLNTRNVPAYKELTKELKDLRVPLEQMRDIVATVLGWSSEAPVLV